MASPDASSSAPPVRPHSQAPAPPPPPPPPSTPSPPDDMYTMPFLPPLPPLTPNHSYQLSPPPDHLQESGQREELHHPQPGAAPPRPHPMPEDDPFDQLLSPPPSAGDLSYSGDIIPYSSTMFPERIGEEFCSWDDDEELSLPWINEYCAAISSRDNHTPADGRKAAGEEEYRGTTTPTENPSLSSDTTRSAGWPTVVGRGAVLLPISPPPPPPPPPQQQQTPPPPPQIGWLELQMQRWSGMAKAARSKRRMARQMSTSAVPRFVLTRRSGYSSSSSSSSTPSAAAAAAAAGMMRIGRRNACGISSTATRKKSPAPAAARPCPPLFPPIHMGLRYVLHKELKNSDVTTLGRIVLPKRESETFLPFLAVKEGIQITVKDMFSSNAWRMRYRFWPNNKSRMYVLENTGDYIRQNGLKCGDVVALYQDESKQLYICATKVENTPVNHSFVGCTKEEKKDEQYMQLIEELPEASSGDKVESCFTGKDTK